MLGKKQKAPVRTNKFSKKDDKLMIFFKATLTLKSTFHNLFAVCPLKLK